MCNVITKIYAIFAICFSATWLYAMDSLDDESKVITSLNSVSLRIDDIHGTLRITRRYNPISTEIKLSSPGQEACLDSRKVRKCIRFMDDVAYDKLENSRPVVIPDTKAIQVDIPTNKNSKNIDPRFIRIRVLKAESLKLLERISTTNKKEITEIEAKIKTRNQIEILKKRINQLVAENDFLKKYY